MRVKLSMNFFSADGIMFEARDSEGNRIIHEWDDSAPVPMDTMIVHKDGSETPAGKVGDRKITDPGPRKAEPTTFSEITTSLVPDDVTITKEKK